MKNSNRLRAEAIEEIQTIIDGFRRLCSERIECDGPAAVADVEEALLRLAERYSFSRILTSHGARRVVSIDVEKTPSPERAAFVCINPEHGDSEPASFWLTPTDAKMFIAKLQTALDLEEPK